MTSKKSQKNNNKPRCEFCNKTFVRESTLMVHTCEKKRRFKQMNESGPRLGLIAYNIFLKYSLHKPEVGPEDFINTSFYSAFVKFGWYAHQIRPINFEQFVKWLLDNKVKLDWWTKDRYYEKFASEYMLKEPPDRALARTIDELDKWAADNNSTVDRFFLDADKNTIFSYVSNGRITPWLLYNCAQGVEYLSSLPTSVSKLIFKWIDPAKWEKRLASAESDVEWVQAVLDEAGFNETNS